MSELNELLLQRRSKLTQIREKGINPYPYRFEATHRSSEITGNFDALSESKKAVRIAGRLMSIRGHGKTSFAHMQDAAGRIQIYVRKNDVGEDPFKVFDLFDLGDIIYNDGSNWALADNTDLAKAGTNVVTQATSSYFYYAGPGCVIVFSADQSWTKGDPIYLEDAVLGKPSQVLPPTPGNWINHMGYADSDRAWSFQINEVRRA